MSDERPDVTIVSYLGREITKGTAVPANRHLPTISLAPKLKVETKQFRAGGSKYETASVKHKQSSDGGYDGILDYNSFIYILNGLTVPVVTPAAVAGSTSAKLWSYRPLSRQVDNPHAYTIEVGDGVAADQFAYSQFSSLTANLGQDDMKINGNLFARTMVPNITQGGAANEIQRITIAAGTNGGTFDLPIAAHSTTKTALLIPWNVTADNLQGILESLDNIAEGDVLVTGGPGVSAPLDIQFTGTLAGINIATMVPSSTNLTGGSTHTATVTVIQEGGAATAVTEIPERPVARGEINCYLDNDYANIGTTLITDAFEEEIQLGEKYKPKFVHNRNFKSWKDSIEIAPSLVFFFMAEHNGQSRAILADAIANDTVKYMRVNAAGLDLSTAQDGSVTELIQFDLSGKFANPIPVPNATGQGVYGYKYPFVALDDPIGMGRAWQADIINTRSAL